MGLLTGHILLTVVRIIIIIIMQSEVRLRPALFAVGVREVHQGCYATVVSIVHFRACRKSSISLSFNIRRLSYLRLHVMQ
jgi:hypothetical protein